IAERGRRAKRRNRRYCRRTARNRLALHRPQSSEEGGPQVLISTSVASRIAEADLPWTQRQGIEQADFFRIPIAALAEPHTGGLQLANRGVGQEWILRVIAGKDLFREVREEHHRRIPLPGFEGAHHVHYVAPCV